MTYIIILVQFSPSKEPPINSLSCNNSMKWNISKIHEFRCIYFGKVLLLYKCNDDVMILVQTKMNQMNHHSMRQAGVVIHLICLGQFNWFYSFVHALTEELFWGWTLLSMTRCRGQDATSHHFQKSKKFWFGLLKSKHIYN